ncbi:MAG TPA: hypothetical protein IAC20_00150 [Candidatus Faecisoma merdavium]|nr:hypothetical protein [Candidatus Faecisoma merdavium]
MPSKYEFEQIIVKLEEAVKLYKKSDYRYNENKLYLSNGQILEFMFKPENIPHLLGINISALRNSKILSSNKPLDMLEELIQRYTAIYQKFVRGELIYSDVVSPYIKEKIESFETVLKCDINDIYFVSEYSLPRAYLNGERNNYGCQYYIAFEDGKSEIIFLGLKKPDDQYYYSPSSIISPSDEKSSDKLLADLISNQRVMIVNCVVRKNIGIFNYLKNADKLILAQRLVNLTNEYNGHLMLSNDFIYNLKKLMSSYEKDLNVQRFILQLIYAISTGKKISIDCSFDQNCADLVEVYNMSVQRSNKADIQTDLQELKRLKEELLLAKSTIEEQKQLLSEKDELISLQQTQLNEQQGKINQMQDETSSLRQFKDEAFQLFKKFQ